MSVISYTFPAAAICFVALLFLGLRSPVLLPPPPTVQRRGVLPILVITAVYAVVAFFGLGNATAPQSFCALQRSAYVTLTLPETETIGALFYYTGLGTGDYTVSLSTDGVHYTNAGTMSQQYADLFKWKYAEFDEDADCTARYIRITAGGSTELGEVAVYRADGTKINVSASDSALLDEQSLVPDAPDYLNSTYFDEIYHARTAYEHLRNVKPYEVSHPPLGKLILSLGIALFGMTPLGWRFMGTLFGVLMLPVLWDLLRRMFRDDRIAVCGTLLFAFDFMHFTQTRIATIDTYAVCFILLMYLFLYRYFTERKLLYLGLSGLFFGIGAACKWTCLYAGAGLGVLWLLHWVFRGVKDVRSGAGKAYARALLGNIGFCLVFFVALPCCIYYVSYTPYATAAGMHGAGMYFTHDYFNIVWENQKFMFTYHAGLEATHPYSAPWWQWILDIRPILYYLDYGEGTVSSIAAFVNPLLCWAGLLSMFVLGYHTIRQRDRKALFILIGYLAQMLPWVFISRITFEYHYFPATVFLVLGLCYVFDLLRQRGKLGSVYCFTAVCLSLFAVYYPVLSGLEISQNYAWYFLKWFPSWPF